MSVEPEVQTGSIDWKKEREDDVYRKENFKIIRQRAANDRALAKT